MTRHADRFVKQRGAIGRTRMSRGVLASGLAFAFSLLPLRASADDLLVFAAASLKPALDEIIALPEAAAIGEIKPSYAASSQLARQIEAGAPAALFISADEDWMDAAASQRKIVVPTRTDLLGNALVLIAPKDSKTALRIAPGFDLADALGKDGRLALGEPNSVPAGKYAKASLMALGAWDLVAHRIVAAENVRAALNFVARGEAPLGVVYRSDAMSEPAVRVVDTFPPSSHAPIVYPAAVVSGHDTPAARKLLDLLRAPATAAIFRRHGFDAPPRR
ncbi:MAG TPA: molybdate ABC transporter substrate-binding protein [Rhodanobacteraceae bacterium]|nr:molybdate ABC transporter substrate-binding protein [Rhodanobacteraceae bacterium]